MTDPNDEIAHLLGAWPVDVREPYHMGLQIIKDAGRNGIAPNTLSTRIRKTYGRKYDKSFYDMMVTIVLPNHFSEVIRTDHRNRMFWRDRAVDQLDEVDHKVRRHIDTIFRSYDLMRELTQKSGTFTENELSDHLMSRLNLTRESAHAVGHHMLDQFRHLLTTDENSYAVLEETPVTRSETMDLFRSLADMKKKS